MSHKHKARSAAITREPFPGPYDTGIEERMRVFRYVRDEFENEVAAAIVSASIIMSRALKETAGMERIVTDCTSCCRHESEETE